MPQNLVANLIFRNILGIKLPFYIGLNILELSDTPSQQSKSVEIHLFVKDNTSQDIPSMLIVYYSILLAY
jgi:hypothetical protein